eukprot:g951.t1
MVSPINDFKPNCAPIDEVDESTTQKFTSFTYTTRKIVSTAEKIALFQWLLRHLPMTPLQSTVIFALSTYWASLRILCVNSGKKTSAFLTRMQSFMGDDKFLHLWRKDKSTARRKEQLLPYREKNLIELLFEKCKVVFFSSKFIIAQSVLIPLFLKTIKRVMAGKKKSTTTQGKEKALAFLLSQSLLRTTISILSMPILFWTGFFGLLHYGSENLCSNDFVIALLPTIGALGALGVEGRKKANLFAIFMLYTAMK